MDPEEIARAQKWFAVECNNRAWALTAKSNRNEDEDREMLLNACASALHWSASEEPVNNARASVLLASVFGRLGIGAQAVREARRALAHFEGSSSTDWDLAFANSAMAWAASAAGDIPLHETHYLRAQELGELIADLEDKNIFLAEMALVPETVRQPVAASGKQDDRTNEIEAAIFAGKKIEAIKLYRAQTGVGLKDGKEAIDRITADLREHYPQKFTAKPATGCLGITISAMAVGVGLVVCLAKGA